MNPEFLEIELFNSTDFYDLVLRITFNLVVVLILSRFLYYRLTPRKSYLFTFILISQIVFLILFLLDNVGLNMGFALGMFAVFGIIRYRTQQIPPREMTYLFLVIGVSVINGLANRKVSYAELVLANMAVIVTTYLLEKVFLLKNEQKKEVVYDKVELVKPERRVELISDLEERTGLRIHRVEIGRIDYMRDSARVFIYFFNQDNWGTGSENEPDDGDDGD